jgi:dTDP-4-dehydrorhamnose 3,5-epimerase
VKLRALRLTGAYVVEPEVIEDGRGSFARTWCYQEFRASGLVVEFVQGNVTRNRLRGTIRGLHYQIAPHEEAKLVRCSQGRVYDVIVDLRDHSPTRWQWEAVELSAEDLQLLFVPAGFAHGYQTLTDDAELTYEMSQYYCAEAARGLRWDEPSLKIKWPIASAILSQRDREHPLVAPR